MKDIPLDLLRSLVTFADSPNIVVAAERLNISQPLLSKHLRLLEESSDRPLFAFEGRRKVLTDEGRELYTLVKRRLAELEADVADLAMRQARPESVTLRLSGRPEFLEYLAGELTFPGHIVFQPMPGRDVLRALIARESDLGITQHEMDSLQFLRKPLFKDIHHIVVPSSWKVKSKDTADLLRELLTKPNLSYGGSDRVQVLLEHYGIEGKPRVIRSIPHWPTIGSLISRGLGWAVMPSFYFAGGRSFAIHAKILSELTFYLYYQRERAKLDWFQQTVAEMQNVFCKH